MKKLTSILAGVTLILAAVSAWAIPTTWKDVLIWQPALPVPPTQYFVHNITDDVGGVAGFKSIFMGGNDTISSYILTLSLHDDKNPDIVRICNGTFSVADGAEAALITTSGGFYSYNFALASNDFTGGLLGRLDLMADGRLGVYVSSTLGDFMLDSSTLIVKGDNGDQDSAPVPEPGTLLLLGSGLIGLASYGKRRMSKSS